MKVRPLIIGTAEKRLIEDLRVFARENVMDPQRAVALAQQDAPAFRDMMRLHSLELPVGYMVTFSHERQPDIGECRHISVSVDTFGKAPGIPAVEMILEAFGMRPLRHSLKVWVEDVDDGHKAVNVVQRL